MSFVEGTVMEIIYRNDENGYTVLELDCDGSLVVCVGTIPLIQPGEYVRFYGAYTTHKNYGEQFKVASMESKMPEGDESIKLFLSGGLIKGIGEVLAHRIVQEFHKDTFNIIENHPEELAKIKGISRPAAERIQQQFKEVSSIRGVVIELQKLGLTNTIWAMIIPGMLSVYNMIVLRTSFESVPESLYESAALDGANHFTMLTKITLPLSKAALATITLFYAVGKWGEWYNALVYLQKRRDLYPLQMFLRELLVKQEDMDALLSSSVGVAADSVLLQEIIKYATIIVTTVPILLVYPFLQKYFVKGVLVGSVKE